MKKIIGFFILMFGYCAFICAQQDTFLVKPYLQFGTKNSMIILWETNDATKGYLEYTEAKENTKTLLFDNKIDITVAKTLHEITIQGLKPATKYVYKVTVINSNGTKLEAKVSTFKTNVNDDDAFFFALIGDTQRNGRTPWAWGKIAERIYEERPNFVVLAGDLVDKGTQKSDWTQHFFPYGNIAMSRYPVYSVLGNHEQDAQHYYNYMANPAPEYYYTFYYGNAQFLMIDSNRDLSEDSEQYNWLETELAKSKATWKFVVHHHPPYSSDSDDHGNTLIGASTLGTSARNLVPLYERFGVDFCMFGHTHLYERTWPLFQNGIDEQNGVVYINSGGAGGGLEDFDPVRSWFSIEQQAVHHYCTFAIHDETLIFKAIDHSGQLFDSFELKKKNKKTVITTPCVPRLKFDRSVFDKSTVVTMEALFDDYTIRYTTDGSTPNTTSKQYVTPISIDQSCMLKAACFSKYGETSRVTSHQFTKMQAQKSLYLPKLSKGLTYAYYEGEFDSIPMFKDLTPKKTGEVITATLENIPDRNDNFAILFEGYIDIDSTGYYTFYTYSDDGSQILINDQLLVDSDGDHGAIHITGSTLLQKGLHKLEIRYFQNRGGTLLASGLVDSKGNKKPFSPWQLFHK